jgi:glucosamine-6-phosphate deaminase
MESYQSISQKAARTILTTIKTKPQANLGLPTGNTPKLMYEYLVQLSKEAKLDWNGVNCFALDDYLDVPWENSFQSFLEEHLYSKINLPVDQQHTPFLIENYDNHIESLGGLDLTILGIGRNGHIAFNEPQIPLASYTHCTWLTESTRRANQADFDSLEEVPTRGVTMGLTTVFNSKKIILLASGSAKEEVLNRAFSGEITTELPASILVKHPNISVWTDFGFTFERNTSMQELV